MNDNEKDGVKPENKWDFADYAFTITGIFVGVVLVVPELLEALFGINLLGGSLASLDGVELEDAMSSGVWTIYELRPLSPLLFLLTITIVMFKEAFDAKIDGGYQGSVFNHTFESLLEDAIYMAITTVMLYSAIFFGAMYISWLAGPITWILFIFIFPMVKRKSDKAKMPLFLLTVFLIGVIAELITGAWIAFPLSWLLICTMKFGVIIREKIKSTDDFFNFFYYGFSVILMAVGLILNFWIMSWIAFPVAFSICWAGKKLKFFT